MTESIYLFAGGGTGGHLYPGIAVADELTRLHTGVRIVFACSDRQIDRRVLDPLDYAVVPQPVRPLPRGLRGWGRFLGAWWRSRRQARQMIDDLNPRAVLGLGGFAAGPIVRQAAARGVRTGLLNPDAVPGIANRFLSRHADAVFTQFAGTADRLPAKARERVRCVGCPIRHNLGWAEKRDALEQLGLRTDRKTLLVFGGSLLAESLVEMLIAASGPVRALADRWQLLVLARAERADELHRALSEGEGGMHLVTLSYCQRMDLAWEAADAALCRGGAVTVAELAATSTPAVIFPYPHHRDAQQKHNAAALVEAGAAEVCDDACDATVNAERLRGTLLPILRDASRLGAMELAACRIAKPRAAREVAEWLSERR
jgi:UDP-N-acetylglucosamine--N-acetylmuramyl-(pentapeptide) pyrophosphoryl-undecaprenol N-acetylglucosamine transferase